MDTERYTYAGRMRQGLEAYFSDDVVREMRSCIALIPKDHKFSLTTAEHDDAYVWFNEHCRKQGFFLWLGNKFAEFDIALMSEFCPCGSRVVVRFYGGPLQRVYERTGSPCSCEDDMKKMYARVFWYDPDSDAIEITLPSGAVFQCKVDF